MLTFIMQAKFDGQYIGNPYWTEMYTLIEITKQSGVNRARTAQNRRKALEDYLKAHNMTLADFEKLEALAKRPFHTNDKGEIIIPAERVISFLVATCDEVRSAMRPCDKEQVRSRFQVTDWTTGKFKPDGIWSRFVTVSGGAGNKLSNQRGLREDQYIENFTAKGEISCDPAFVNTKVLKDAIDFGGRNVGIGAARKMGKGRFTLLKFQ